MKISSADEYQIVSCNMHSELELAIMHGKNLTLTLKALSTVEDKMVIQLKPTDIVTRGQNTPKGEFLIGIDKAENLVEIRLDKIMKIKSG